MRSLKTNVGTVKMSLAQAMAALAKSVELDEEQVYYIGGEEDLKPLASLPEFKKLLPPPAEPQP